MQSKIRFFFFLLLAMPCMINSMMIDFRDNPFATTVDGYMLSLRAIVKHLMEQSICFCDTSTTMALNIDTRAFHKNAFKTKMNKTSKNETNENKTTTKKLASAAAAAVTAGGVVCSRQL